MDVEPGCVKEVDGDTVSKATFPSNIVTGERYARMVRMMEVNARVEAK